MQHRKLTLGRSGGFLSLGLVLATGAACSDYTTGDRNDPFANLGRGGGGGALPALTDGGLPVDTNGGAAAVAPGTGGMTAEIPVGAEIGDDCSNDDCRAGLVCNADDVCEAAGTSAVEAECVVSDECAEGLVCLRLECVEAGDGVLGDPCFQDVECEKGLRCGVVGFSTQCVAQGAGVLGDDCAASSDCLGGLACLAGVCGAPQSFDPSAGLPVNLTNIWPGAECEARSTGEVRAFFELPGVDDPAGEEGDFFRLPYPNDALLVNGRLDLSGYPTPGAAFLGFDPVKVYVDALEDTATGFSPSSVIYFRFSGIIDFDSLNGKGPLIVDITPGSVGRDQGGSWYTTASTGDISSNKYICHNWLAVRRDRPFEPGRTYAVLFLNDGVVDEDGQALRTSEQLAALMAEATPGDGRLAQAHEAYAPFREFLADPMRAKYGADDTVFTADDVLNATVFTVEDTRAPMEALAAAVYAEDVPVIKDWVKCETGAKSPCPQAEEDRACGDGTADYDEYHALVELPIFQRGTAPYLTIEDGGDIDTTGPVRTEDVCLSVTVPKAGAPNAVAVFGHGTGGSFRSNVTAAVAGALSEVATPAGTTVRFVTVGIDEPQHGPRRGESTESPNNLFFNFKNPLASRGNPMQGAADYIALGRALQTFTIPGDVTGAEDLVVDGSHLVFFGHSQGSTHGSLAMPYAEEYQAVVLSGNGGSLRHGLVTKTSPENIPAGVALALQEFTAGDLDNLDTIEVPDGHFCDAMRPDAPCAVWHPVLNLLQQYIDPADPINFAAELTRVPAPDEVAKHVFQTLGVGDTYSPVEQMILYARAGSFNEVDKDPSAGDGVVIFYDGTESASTQPPPYSGADTNATVAVRQYGPPEDSDGHFVVFDVASATADVARFLAMGATDEEKPAVGE